MTAQARALARVIADLNACWQPHPAQQTILHSIFGGSEPSAFVECGRKFGKSELLLYFLWRGALTLGGGWYYFAPEQKQAKEIIWAAGRIQSFGPQLYVSSVNNTEMRITFETGAFIKVDGSDNYNAYRGIEPKGAAYDEYRDFRPEFHRAFGPNLAVYKAPLLICGTPPEALELDHYDSLREQHRPGRSLFNFPTWQNPHIDRDWLRKERERLIARGETDVWQREYEAKRVIGGSNAIFPMWSRAKHVRPHADVTAEVLRDRRKLIWQVIADPGTATRFAVIFRAINPYTRKVYRLAEIYEGDQLETTTSRIIPRIQALKEELFPGWEAHGIEWEQLYDEAAAWFAAEAIASFGDHWTPTSKATKPKDAGLSLMKDQLLHGLTVVSDRCVNYIREVEGYIRDKDGKIPKKNDHLLDCIAGHEPVLTARGFVPIADVRAGDRVWTREGYRDVMAQWEVGIRDVISLHLSDGRTLTCTPEHRVYTENRGFVEAIELTDEDVLNTLSIGGHPWSMKSSSTASSSAAIQNPNERTTGTTIDPRPTSSEPESATSIAKSGRRHTARFLQAITFTIATVIRSITRLKTWSASLQASICASTIPASRRPQSARTSTGFDRSPLIGIVRGKVASGIACTGKTLWPNGPCLDASASNAEPSTSQSTNEPAFAPMPASQPIGENRGLMTFGQSARSAESLSSGTSTRAQRSRRTAPVLVRQEPAGRIAVFDLKIADTPEFWANGVLVHNCDRYGNDFASCDLTPTDEPEPKDPLLERRAYRPEDDIRDADDDFALDF